ncbi:hypothetical protein [Persicitalea sp.]|uniref:hypothetical protein n=1 Tax=Persicitalea sp. TaxID=3100273 RepID=UPI00359362A0
MKAILTFLALSLVALLISCEKPLCYEKPNDEIAGIVVKVLGENGSYLAYREGVGDLNRFGMLLATDKEYRLVFEYCCAGKLDSVDFAEYDILGLGTLDKGRNSTYLREVQIDDNLKKVVYTVSERYCKRSSPVRGNGNFVIVPKLPIGYSIEYVRK